MFSRLMVLLGVGVLAGCVQQNPAVCDANRECSDSGRPFCDLFGEIGHTPGACIAVHCVPGQFGACELDNDHVAEVCNANGDGYDFVTCANGCDATEGCKTCSPGAESCDADGNVVKCNDMGIEVVEQTCPAGCTQAPSPHCSYLEPRYLPDICDVPATAASLVFDVGGPTLDPSNAPICTGGTVVQSADAKICVIRATTIQVAAGATLRFHSTGPSPAVALVADDLVDIAGVLDVGATSYVSGPGGGTFQGGFAGGNDAGGPTSGAGAGGNGGRGGSGCDSAGAATSGGAIATSPAIVDTLRGGGYAGGGGGGAITLIACRGTVRVSGTITSSGGGGAAGITASHGNAQGGGGGGAGGTIVMQGLALDLTGQFYANGGSGGGNSGAGQDGATSLLAATGGGGTLAGGNGAVQGTVAASGGCNKAVSTVPGGGGGALGFVLTYAPPSGRTVVTPSKASPSLDTVRAPNLR